MRTINVILTIILIFLADQIHSQIPAFPGAEGFGKYTTGGRGGTVYYVSNLNDEGPGSFRDAVSQSNRIVVFEVGGVINISSRIVISKNITIAGQTAPGDGITIYGNGIALTSSSGNDIIRYIRIRMGVNGDSEKDAIGISGGQNYIFDHVSVSWGRDGTVDINGTGIDNITLQDCIIAQGLHSHSTGGLMQSGKASVIRTLYIDNHTRNPKGRGIQEYINNVVYNWRVAGYILGDTEGLSEANIIGNYFISGPSTSSGPFNRATTAFHAYISENWYDSTRNGLLDGANADSSVYGPVTFMGTSYAYHGVDTILTPLEAYNHIVENAGASAPRDAVDSFLIDQLKSLGTKGTIISNETENGIINNVGILKIGKAPLDTDRDGMPDEWEFMYGLNLTDKSDQNLDTDNDGYTNIEEYLNGTDAGMATGSLPDGIYYIQAKHSNKMLDVSGNSAVKQNEMLDKAFQAWEFSSDTGFTLIKNLESGLVMGVNSASTDNGAAIVQNAVSTASENLWEASFEGYGYFSFSNKNSGKAMTVENGDTLNNAAVVQYTFMDSSYQQFRLIPYDTVVGPPIAMIASPANGTLYLEGEDIVIEAFAEDPDGDILNVMFFNNSVKIGEDSIAPYSYTWTGVSEGNYNLIILTMDNDSLLGQSETVNITVLPTAKDGAVLQENRLGFCDLDGPVDSDNAGYTGDGFCNTKNAEGMGINWKTGIPSAGSYQINFRYANGSDNRPGLIKVNGVDVSGAIDFPSTGSWTTWDQVSTTVEFQVGINELRLEATTSGGLANIDYIEIVGAGVDAVDCEKSDSNNYVFMETYNDIAGKSVNDLYFDDKFPALPDETLAIFKLETPFDKGNNFGTRIRGFIHPPKTDNYIFWISGSEACQLWLNPSDTLPDEAEIIARVDETTGKEEWDKFNSQMSDTFNLSEGQKYYFEILHKTGYSEDHVEVSWQSTDISHEIITSQYLTPWTDSSTEGVVITNTKTIEQDDIRIYPNPVKNTLFVVSDKINLPMYVSIIDIQGKILFKQIYTGRFIEINTSVFEPGIYFVCFTDKDKTRVHKILKE